MHAAEGHLVSSSIGTVACDKHQNDEDPPSAKTNKGIWSKDLELAEKNTNIARKEARETG